MRKALASVPETSHITVSSLSGSVALYWARLPAVFSATVIVALPVGVVGASLALVTVTVTSSLPGLLPSSARTWKL